MPKRVFILQYTDAWGVYAPDADHPDDALSWHATKAGAERWVLEQGYKPTPLPDIFVKDKSDAA